MSKGISPLVAYVLTVFISIAGIVVVITIGLPAVQRAKESGTFNEALHNLQIIDNAIREVASEGIDSQRTVQLGVTGGEYRVNNDTGTLTFSFVSSSGLMPYGSYAKQGNIRIFGGGFNGLVAYWNFDESSGSTADDSSGQRNDGTLYDFNTTNTDGNTPPQWVDGKFDKALSFDGVDDYVLVKDSDSLDITDEITIEAWVYWKGGSGWRSIISKPDANTQWSEHYILTLENGNYLNFITTNSTGENRLKYFVAFPQNTWTYVVGIFNGTNKFIYINGDKVAQNSWGGPLTTSDSYLLIGADRNWQESEDITQFFNGTIDEVRIYSRALSEQEIKNMYEGSKSTVNITMLLTYPKIKITGNTRIGTGNYKLCIKKTGYSYGKAVVSVNVC